MEMVEFLKELFLNMRIRDVIDIAIVAYVFYKLMGLIKETRAEQLIKGIIFILLATQLSEWLGLYTINWILKNTLTVGVIAILVVFQPELRRGLERIGRSKFFGNIFEKSSEEQSTGTIDEIIKAVQMLSKDKVGALIVIERETKLGEVIETGIHLDSLVSGELIINTFIPNTPLHDGAMIIRGDRIVASGCFLPLTENQGLSKQLGTRHRAGLGITENSDSVVVIVSEETGIISLAMDGKLSRYLDIQSLRQILIDVLVEKEQNPIQFNWLKWRRKK
ncbi:diadenylate cyclase [Garciella nitratireducens DSM 15102]|uniref:Diadenylate cyclase n=2 Tax=Garciella TaxID=218204 RepID=A0A1T4MV38_9FIRM|nr:diadenylate cyclase [Garciella nitratireducens DSM 15102]